MKIKFGISLFFANLSTDFDFEYRLTRITGTLHKDIGAFVVVSGWILLVMRNISDKICRENQNTHFVLSKFFIFPDIRALYRIKWKNVVQPEGAQVTIYSGADKSLARPTSHCILFDAENISCDSSLVIYVYIYIYIYIYMCVYIYIYIKY